MAPLLEVKDLHISFRTDAGLVEAVRGVSFALEEGEVLGLVGESGCGKSVTTMALMGLIQPPGFVAKGEILYRGRSLTKLSSKEWRSIRGKELAMIFQDPMTSLNPFMTVGAQIMEVLQIHTSLSPKEQRKRAASLLDAVGLPDPEARLDVHPHQFSGGMRQRVMIAMALAGEPKILLADEPTTALDVTIQAQILDLLEDLQAKEGISVLLITHDLGIVASFCDRVQVMYAGNIVERGDASSLFAKPLHPYTEGLLRSVPTLDPGQTTLEGIPGQPPHLINPPVGCAFAPRCAHAQAQCSETFPPEEALGTGHVRCFHHAQERREKSA